MISKNFLWTEKYRPDKIEDCILPVELRSMFENFVKEGYLPNLLLTGSPGTGKTTAGLAALKELDCDVLFIDGSKDGNINTLRTDIQNFATTMSFGGKRKYVFIDEADNLNANSTQPGLRSFMEAHSKNCGFVFTCNYPHKIIEPLRSRFGQSVDFKIPADERPVIAVQVVKRLRSILDKENVRYNPNIINHLVLNMFPDVRMMINTMQRHSSSGELSSAVLSASSEAALKELVLLLREKDFKAIRVWTAENQAINSHDFYNGLYELLEKEVDPSTLPTAILVIGDYMKSHANVVSPQIHYTCCAVELMNNVKFK